MEALIEKKASRHKRKAGAPDGQKVVAHLKKPKKAHKKPGVVGKSKVDTQRPPRAHTSPHANATSFKHEGGKVQGW